MMTWSDRLRSTNYGRKFSMFQFRSVFDPFRVEIGEIRQPPSRKIIISAFCRAWPHVKIPTRTEVTSQNVSAFQLFPAHFYLLGVITGLFFIQSSQILVWKMKCGWGRTISNDVMMTLSPHLRSADYGRKFHIFKFRRHFDPFRVGDKMIKHMHWWIMEHDSMMTSSQPFRFTDFGCKWHVYT